MPTDRRRPGRFMTTPPPLNQFDEPIEQLHARLAAIVASSDDAIASKDLNGVVKTWNAAAERIFGYTAAEMIGRPIAMLVPDDRPNEEHEILERLKRGERVDHFETVRVRKDGRRIDVSVTISPIRDAGGEVVGASKIVRDITNMKAVLAERERLLARERAAREEAERVGRAKDEFLATLSHELRTPLNAILGWAHILRTGGVPPQDVATGLETIERNARLQTQLIEELLDMSRIISGKLRLDVQPVDLQLVIADAVESMRPAADAKNIKLHKLLDPSASTINGDPNRLQQVLWNLLSNAIKFTPKGGNVQVILRRVNSQVEVSVSDTGQGIHPDFIPQLFNRFTQADASSTRRHGGLGLGLAIVKHLVELHGGSVRASSPGEGQGSTFTIRLPLSIVRQHTPLERTVKPRADAAAADAEAESFSLLVGRDEQRVDLAGVRVLVVDDELDARVLIRRVLESCHAEVVLADSAAAALETLERAGDGERPPDVLVCDIGMPDVDGYQLLQRVRSLQGAEGKRLPAVALTAMARSEDRRRALLAGFQLHVAKPVEPVELVVAVANLAGVAQGDRSTN
jgi:PAS domain S-box-containing protein